MRHTAATVVAGMILGYAAISRAQAPTGDPAAGRLLAQRWCSTCHNITSRHAHSTDVAPSFYAVAKMPSTTSKALHAFLQTPHGQMPDYNLSRKQIDDVTAYILSLRDVR